MFFSQKCPLFIRAKVFALLCQLQRKASSHVRVYAHYQIRQNCMGSTVRPFRLGEIEEKYIVFENVEGVITSKL